MSQNRSLNEGRVQPDDALCGRCYGRETITLDLFNGERLPKTVPCPDCQPEVIPLFPPGVHDVVTTHEDGRTSVACSAGDWGPVGARTDDEVRWAREAAYLHAAKHRREPCRHGCEDGCDFEETQ